MAGPGGRKRAGSGKKSENYLAGYRDRNGASTGEHEVQLTRKA